MDQPTHAWIAVRAAALLEDCGGDKGLVEMLAPHASRCAIGAWIPDLADDRRGAGAVQLHVFKMEPVAGTLKPETTARFTVSRDELLHRLSSGPETRAFLSRSAVPSPDWWSKPYKANPSPGQHVANRAMGLWTALRDFLILGDARIDACLPGEVAFTRDVDAEAKTPAAQAALHFFILSHFVADSCMMCHCDARPLAGYDGGIHHELEQYWGTLVGHEFQHAVLSGPDAPGSDALLKRAREIDEDVGVKFENKVRPLSADRDVWLEMVDMCRASYAMMNIVAPPESFPKGTADKAHAFTQIFGGAGKDLLRSVTRSALHDAVYNTAMLWSDLWRKVMKV